MCQIRHVYIYTHINVYVSNKGNEEAGKTVESGEQVRVCV